jgi:very-short-patch-repair endonuclease
LIDVGGNNRLLYYRTTSSTIVLDAASSAGVSRLLAGDAVRLTDLFTSPDALQRAQRACALLAKKQQEATEEYGVSIAYLAAGMCSWDPEGNPGLTDATTAQIDTADLPVSSSKRPKYTRPRAPVLLRSLQLSHRRGVQESWDLRLTEEFQINGVLKHVLNADNERIHDDALLNLDASDLPSIQAMLNQLKEGCWDVADFEVEDTLVLGTFSYTKQPMVDDVSDIDALGMSDLAAALSGDLEAAERVRSSTDGVTEEMPDYEPVDSEYLVLDADASQSYVVNAALAGRNLVVQGPPGTGKSQTIANIIATSVAAGRSVLFVAQKRAAVSAVLDRLAGVDLTHLVLDLFAASSSRRYVAEQLQTALDRQASAGEARVDELHYSLTRSRDTLVRHKNAMHAKSRGWGVSVADMIALSIGTPADVHSDERLLSSEIALWGELEPTRIRQELGELARIGALETTWSTAAGWSPRGLTSEEALRGFNDLLQRLNAALPLTERALALLTSGLAATSPDRWESIDALRPVFEEADRLRQLASATLDPHLASTDLRDCLLATSRQFRKETGEKIGGRDKREAARRAKTLVGHIPRGRRADVLARALSLRDSWPGYPPYAGPESWTDPYALLQEYRADLGRLDQALQGMNLAGRAISSLQEIFRQLAVDRQRAVMPRAHESKTRLTALGLSRLLQTLEERADVNASDPARAGLVFDRVVSASILDEALLFDPDLASIDGAELNAVAGSYRRDDLSHLAANAVRIRRLAAERLKRVLDANPDQYLKLKTETTRKTKFTPIRRLLHDLPDVMLNAKPVWAMSPLQVSRLLPLEALFDVVIFDEASQVKPADAIPAILRGRQLIVAGDSRQLPPTEFFTKILDDHDDDVDEDAVLEFVATVEVAPRRMGSLTRDAESILFAMDRLLAGQSRRLLWHYRSRDERLIAVSNSQIYERSLTTFPAADTPDAIGRIEAPPSPGIDGGTNSPEQEVAAVVAAVSAHARNHPGETLGVIAFGVKHQRRLESALDVAFEEDPELYAILNTKTSEPFFVKAVERVQGDERDAIILSVGYGKASDGKLRLFWGPLLQPGGERRLNVAISRARLRMTLVSSFGPHDMAEDAHDSRGYKLMYHFMKFMASGGVDLGGAPNRATPLNAFEIDIRDRLTAAGLHLDAQVGVGSYRIDFAARHPTKPGRHVLAIEADGASYHSGHTARERDRLRQQLLERRGWIFHRIWSTDWFNNADHEIEATLHAFEAALDRPEQGAPITLIDVPVAWELPVGNRTVDRPGFNQGFPIDGYPADLLLAVIRWIRSDQVIRNADDELALAMTELGFQKRGSRIVGRIQQAQLRADLA